MDRADRLLAAVAAINVQDLAGRILADPDRAMVSLAGQIALAQAAETYWAVCIEAEQLVRALRLPITGNDHHDALRDDAIQLQQHRVTELLAAIRGETPTEKENENGNDAG